MNPDDVIKKLHAEGVIIQRKTLYNWEINGLISKPIFRNSRTTTYDAKVIDECIKVHDLIKKSRYELVRIIMQK